MKNVWKFVKWDVPALETLNNSTPYKRLEKLNSGEELTRDEKNSIPAAGVARLMGYVFDYRSFCKKYLVKYKYYGWAEEYAIDKTNVRERAPIKSHVLKIVEIDAE